MTTNGCSVQLAYSGDGEKALTAVAEALSGLGYVLKKRTSTSVKLKRKGKWFTKDPEKMRHYVLVEVQESALNFTFSTGLVASYWTEDDQAWAQRRAQSVLDTVLDAQ